MEGLFDALVEIIKKVPDPVQMERLMDKAIELGKIACRLKGV